MSAGREGASVVREMPVHGGQVRQVMQRFPDAPTPFIDLSTGISPYAYPVVFPSQDALTRLPETCEEDALLQAAARAYGVPSTDMIAAVPGTQMLISLLPYLLTSRDVTIFGPTYSGHETSWQYAGAQVEIVTDAAAFQDATMKSGRVCILCNPNNPDGRLLAASEVSRLARQCEVSGSWLIVDEAFADFHDASVSRTLPQSGLLVLRSFGKSYGLPGVRLGFLVADPVLAGAARALVGSWPVGTLALEAGIQAFSDGGWLERSRRQIQQDRKRLEQLFRRAGLEPLGSCLLFMLIRMAQAQDLWCFLCERGIVTRIFAERLTDLRVGLPRDEDEWSRLNAALLQWCEH